MKHSKISLRFLSAAVGCIIVGCGVIGNNAQMAAGVRAALELCLTALIPSLLPFFVISNILSAPAYSGRIGIVMQPPAKILGVPCRGAGTALLLGLLGGFAPGTVAVNALYAQRQITVKQAQTLLCCVSGYGPAFVIAAVGTGLFGNIITGIILYSANLTATFIGSVIISRLFIKPEKFAPPADETQVSEPDIVKCIMDAIQNIVMVCGYVVVFRCFADSLITAKTPFWVHFLLYTAAETTIACNAAAALSPKAALYLCCAAISFTAFSAIIQMRALLSRDISIRPVMMLRVLHLPLSLGLLRLLLTVFPSAAPAMSVFGTQTMMRFSPDTCAAFFALFTVLLICADRMIKHLQAQKNKV